MQNSKAYNNYLDFSLDRYNKRYNKFKISPKSLGWDDLYNQNQRFNFTIKNLDLNHSSILDIGCGFGDFLKYLIKKKTVLKNYTGIDINDKFITVCKKKFPDFIFRRKDMFNLGKKKYDFIFCFGVFSLKYKGINNFKLMQNFINYAFDYTNKALIINYISKNQSECKPENYVNTFDALKILDYLYKNVSMNISINRSIKKIPFYEESIIIKK